MKSRPNRGTIYAFALNAGEKQTTLDDPETHVKDPGSIYLWSAITHNDARLSIALLRTTCLRSTCIDAK